MNEMDGVTIVIVGVLTSLGVNLGNWLFSKLKKYVKHAHKRIRMKIR